MNPVMRLLSRGLCVGLGLALMSPQAFAAYEQETFHVSLDIPTQAFYVRPVDPALLVREQVMHWDPVQRILKPLSAHFDVKNRGGAIHAYLVDAPFLSNGAARIDLTARFNGRPLSSVGTLVVDAREAEAGARLALQIQPITPAGGYKAGTYYGSLRVVFDASIE